LPAIFINEGEPISTCKLSVGYKYLALEFLFFSAHDMVRNNTKMKNNDSVKITEVVET